MENAEIEAIKMVAVITRDVFREAGFAVDADEVTVGADGYAILLVFTGIGVTRPIDGLEGEISSRIGCKHVRIEYPPIGSKHLSIYVSRD